MIEELKVAKDKQKSKKKKKSRMTAKTVVPKKEYKLQTSNKNIEKKEIRRNIIAKFMITFFLIMITVIVVLFSGLFNIKEIMVEGNSILSTEQVISFSKIEKGTNIFAISKEEVIENVKENSYIEEIKVKRKFPNVVKLIIEERKPEYALQFASSFAYINGQGYILEISNEIPTVPLIVGFTTDLNNIKENNRLDSEDIDKLNVIIKIMRTAANNKMRDLISKIDVSDKRNYCIYLTSEGKIAYLGSGTDLNTRFLYIKAILKEQAGKTGKIYVDMDLNEEYVYFSEEQV